MSYGKTIVLYAAIIVISVFFIWFMMLDFSRFLSLNYEYDVYPSAVLKRTNVILAAFIAWAAGRNGLNSKDSRRMKAVFLFIILGETAFVYKNIFVGVCMFAVCQTLLILRNGIGLKGRLKHSDDKKKKYLMISSLVILLMMILYSVLFSSLIKVHNMILIVYLYGMLLSISLWIGVSSNIMGLLPEKNSKLAAAGMICFYCCDVLVGLDAVLEAGLPWLLANSFIWVFYIPALVLLALSCYKYNKS